MGQNNIVGIDLFGLIRLKLRTLTVDRNDSLKVGIDLFGLIRLKHHLLI